MFGAILWQISAEPEPGLFGPNLRGLSGESAVAHPPGDQPGPAAVQEAGAVPVPGFDKVLHHNGLQYFPQANLGSSMRPASFHAFSTGSYSWQKGEATAGSCAPPQATRRPPTYTACRSSVGRGKGASEHPGEEEVFSETFFI